MLNRQFKKDSFRDIIDYEKLTAKAQFRVGQCPKGIRLQENLTVLIKQAVVASLERAERNQHVAIAKDVQRWLIQINSLLSRKSQNNYSLHLELLGE